MVKIPNKDISIRAQLGKLCHYFPNSAYSITDYGRKFIWRGQLRPSHLSSSYDIKVVYAFGKNPNIFVTAPKPLPLASGASQLPHVYNHEKQHLCLYYRPDSEWTPNKMIADTILPWASEWLLHYEYWVITGEWRGGGVKHN